MILPLLVLGGLGLWLWSSSNKPAARPGTIILTPTTPATLPPIPASAGPGDVADIPSLQARFEAWNLINTGTNRGILESMASSYNAAGFPTVASRMLARAATLPIAA